MWTVRIPLLQAHAQRNHCVGAAKCSSLPCCGRLRILQRPCKTKVVMLGVQLILFPGSLGRIRTQALPLSPASGYIGSNISLQFAFPSLRWQMALSIFSCGFSPFFTFLIIMAMTVYSYLSVIFKTHFFFAFYYWFEEIYNLFWIYSLLVLEIVCLLRPNFSFPKQCLSKGTF